MNAFSFSRVLDFFRGKAITIPPMDGALRPNSALDDAIALAHIPAPDNLVSSDQRTLFSSGKSLYELGTQGGEPAAIAHFDSEIAALAACPDGGLGLALDDGRILLLDGSLKVLSTIPAIGPEKLFCPTALLFADKDTLLVVQGSSHVRPSQWARDLLELGCSGSLWRIDLRTGNHEALLKGLAWPNGIAAGANGAVVVSESWKHRLVEIANRRTCTLLDKLPGYPGRLSPASGSGFWLALFAPRNRLLEFVLGENDYRRIMIAEVDPRFWIAPALSSGIDFREPLQCGGVKTMGVHKPWSPTRSYGLLVRLDADFQPVASYHSRANGTRHGITSALDLDGRVLAASRGGNSIIELTAGAKKP
ncbi:MAG: hypothetical protein PW790_12605 [Parvibaculaceae bacterium]|nr:hypothetical protein [Parvibaculaceae bacterium]